LVFKVSPGAGGRHKTMQMSPQWDLDKSAAYRRFIGYDKLAQSLRPNIPVHHCSATLGTSS